MSETQTFADALIEARYRASVSQSRLAEKAGCEHSFVSRLEGGHRQPSRDMVVALATALRCSPADRDRLLLAAGYAPLVVDEVPELRAFLEEAAGLPVDVLRESIQRARGAAA